MPTIDSLTLLAEGRTAEVYAWDAGRVLKLYRDWCPAHWVEQEGRVARLITASGIPTPAAGETIEVAGRRGILYQRVDGPTMAADVQARPWRLIGYARRLAELQAQFHALQIPGLNSYKISLAHSIEHAAALPDDLRPAVLARLHSLPDGDALCHADFHPENVLITAGGALVIDWMSACRGPQLADVARTSLILDLASRQPRPAFVRWALNLFNRLYVNRYRQLAPHSPEDLAQWRPVIAAARLNEGVPGEGELIIPLIRAWLGQPAP